VFRWCPCHLLLIPPSSGCHRPGPRLPPCFWPDPCPSLVPLSPPRGHRLGPSPGRLLLEAPLFFPVPPRGFLSPLPVPRRTALLSPYAVSGRPGFPLAVRLSPFGRLGPPFPSPLARPEPPSVSGALWACHPPRSGLGPSSPSGALRLGLAGARCAPGVSRFPRSSPGWRPRFFAVFALSSPLAGLFLLLARSVVVPLVALVGRVSSLLFPSLSPPFPGLLPGRVFPPPPAAPSFSSAFPYFTSGVLDPPPPPFVPFLASPLAPAGLAYRSFRPSVCSSSLISFSSFSLLGASYQAPLARVLWPSASPCSFVFLLPPLRTRFCSSFCVAPPAPPCLCGCALCGLSSSGGRFCSPPAPPWVCLLPLTFLFPFRPLLVFCHHVALVCLRSCALSRRLFLSCFPPPSVSFASCCARLFPCVVPPFLVSLSLFLPHFSREGPSWSFSPYLPSLPPEFLVASSSVLFVSFLLLLPVRFLLLVAHVSLPPPRWRFALGSWCPPPLSVSRSWSVVVLPAARFVVPLCLSFPLSVLPLSGVLPLFSAFVSLMPTLTPCVALAPFSLALRLLISFCPVFPPRSGLLLLLLPACASSSRCLAPCRAVCFSAVAPRCCPAGSWRSRLARVPLLRLPSVALAPSPPARLSFCFPCFSSPGPRCWSPSVFAVPRAASLGGLRCHLARSGPPPARRLTLLSGPPLYCGPRVCARSLRPAPFLPTRLFRAAGSALVVSPASSSLAPCVVALGSVVPPVFACGSFRSPVLPLACVHVYSAPLASPCASALAPGRLSCAAPPSPLAAPAPALPSRPSSSLLVLWAPPPALFPLLLLCPWPHICVTPSLSRSSLWLFAVFRCSAVLSPFLPPLLRPAPGPPRCRPGSCPPVLLALLGALFRAPRSPCFLALPRPRRVLVFCRLFIL